MKFDIKKEIDRVGILVDVGKRLYLRDKKVEFSYLDARKILIKEEPNLHLGILLNKEIIFLTNASDDHPHSITWWFEINKPKKKPPATRKKPPATRKKPPATRKKPPATRKRSNIRSRIKKVSEKIISEREEDE